MDCFGYCHSVARSRYFLLSFCLAQIRSPSPGLQAEVSSQFERNGTEDALAGSAGGVFQLRSSMSDSPPSPPDLPADGLAGEASEGHCPGLLVGASRALVTA